MGSKKYNSWEMLPFLSKPNTSDKKSDYFGKLPSATCARETLLPCEQVADT